MRKQDEHEELLKALRYHHHKTNGWAALAAGSLQSEDLQRLHTEFVSMRDVIMHYENTVQRILGVQPSPLAEPEPNEEKA